MTCENGNYYDCHYKLINNRISDKVASWNILLILCEAEFSSRNNTSCY